MHVSEVPFSSVVSAHTILCVYVLCTHYVCVPRPSATVQFVFKHACSKINLCICTSVYKFNIDELLLKLLAKFDMLHVFARSGGSRVSETRQSVLALFTQNRTQCACTERSCLSRPNAF